MTTRQQPAPVTHTVVVAARAITPGARRPSLGVPAARVDPADVDQWIAPPLTRPVGIVPAVTTHDD